MWQRVSFKYQTMGRSPAHGLPLVIKAVKELENQFISSSFLIYRENHYNATIENNHHIYQAIKSEYRKIYTRDDDTLIMAWISPGYGSCSSRFAVINYNNILHRNNWLNNRLIRMPKTIRQDDIYDITKDILHRLD